MKSILNTIIALAFACFGLASPAFASTDCTTTVTTIATAVGVSDPGLTVTTLAGVSFTVNSSDASYRAMMSLAESAMITQKSVVVTFAGSGVTCTYPATRTDVTNFVNKGGL